MKSQRFRKSVEWRFDTQMDENKVHCKVFVQECRNFKENLVLKILFFPYKILE